jgi:hypothetical protein
MRPRRSSSNRSTARTTRRSRGDIFFPRCPVGACGAGRCSEETGRTCRRSSPVGLSRARTRRTAHLGIDVDLDLDGARVRSPTSRQPGGQPVPAPAGDGVGVRADQTDDRLGSLWAGALCLGLAAGPALRLLGHQGEGTYDPRRSTGCLRAHGALDAITNDLEPWYPR